MYRDTAHASRPGEQLAVGLGWFSVALGIAELAAPRGVARLIGLQPDPTTITVLRSYGAREIGTGLAILAQPDRPTWLWSRVAGDAIDLATLAGAMQSPGAERGRGMSAAAAVLGVTALDVLCAQQLSENDSSSEWALRQGNRSVARPSRAIRVAEAITINEPIERVEERWSTLPSVPPSLRSLQAGAEGASRSRVEFRQAPGARGTEVHVELEYEPTAGAIGSAVARLLGNDPATRIRDDLRRFKQIVEAGEITLSDGPSLRRPAQPATDLREIREGAGVVGV
jgi:hypothetical protein